MSNEAVPGGATFDIRRLYFASESGRDLMDRITEGLLQEFSQENGLEKLPEEARFEHLAAFLAVRRHFSRALDSAELVTGAGGDTGIDAVAIIINGVLVTDVDVVQELLDQNGYLEVTFIFVQAERTAGYDAAKIGSFGFGVLDFFSDKPKMLPHLAHAVALVRRHRSPMPLLSERHADALHHQPQKLVVAHV